MKFGPVRTEPGVERSHMWALVYAAFATMGLVTGIAVLTPYLLTATLGIDEAHQGKALGALTLVNELTLIAVYGPLGALSDRFGRRAIYAAGMLAMAAAYALYPQAETLAELSLYRIVYAAGVGAATGMLATVVADYAVEGDRGKLVALTGILNGLGIVLTAVLLGKLPSILVERGYDPAAAGRLTAYVAAVACLVTVAALALGLKPGAPAAARAAKPRLIDQLRVGVAAARADRTIALGYASAFVARGDLAIVGLFTIAWGKLAGIQSGLEPAAALEAGRIPFIVAQSAALLWPLAVVLVIDKLRREIALGICMALGGVGYLAMVFVGDPLSSVSWPLFALLGIGQISAFLGAQSLIGKAAPEASRGAVIGLFNFSGAVGILVLSGIGGWLFDAVGPAAPFAVVGVLNFAVAAACFLFRPAPVPEPVS